MTNKSSQRKLLVISMVFPGQNNGSPIAMESSLRLYQEVFDQCSFWALLESTPSEYTRSTFPAVDFSGVGLKRENMGLRFVRTLLSDKPACTSQYSGRHIRILFEQKIAEFAAAGGTHVIVESVAPYILFRDSRNHPSRLMIGLRSHDVLTHAFALLAQQFKGLKRIAWRYESMKVRKLETYAAKTVDHLWAITGEDAALYRRQFAYRCDGVIDVNLDIARYANVAAGPVGNVLHLGGYDARKAQGLYWLVREVWPKVMAKVPWALLVLGGDGSEQFSDSASGVLGQGRVLSDVDFLAQGQIFVNPQRAGSGIKLKSLTAMAAGKILVSTSNGCLGIAVENRREVLVSDASVGMAEHIVELLLNPALGDNIRISGRKFVEDYYSWPSFRKRAIKCVEVFASRLPPDSGLDQNRPPHRRII